MIFYFLLLHVYYVMIDFCLSIDKMDSFLNTWIIFRYLYLLIILWTFIYLIMCSFLHSVRLLRFPLLLTITNWIDLLILDRFTVIGQELLHKNISITAHVYEHVNTTFSVYINHFQISLSSYNPFIYLFICSFLYSKGLIHFHSLFTIIF